MAGVFLNESCSFSPNRACDVGVLTELVRGLERWARGRRSILIRKNAYLVTLALVSPTRNSRSRAQTSIFTIENQHFLVQMAPEASWPPDVPTACLKARSPQPGIVGEVSSARSPQQGFLSQKISFRNPQPGLLSQESSAGSLQPICLGSALESFFQRFSLCVCLCCF